MYIYFSNITYDRTESVPQRRKRNNNKFTADLETPLKEIKKKKNVIRTIKRATRYDRLQLKQTYKETPLGSRRKTRNASQVTGRLARPPTYRFARRNLNPGGRVW